MYLVTFPAPRADTTDGTIGLGTGHRAFSILADAQSFASTVIDSTVRDVPEDYIFGSAYDV